MIPGIEPIRSRYRHKRIPVRWTAKLEPGAVVGSVRDWSEGGFCFEPETTGALIGVGDPVEISMIDDHGQRKSVAGIVRWRGQSKVHSCPAIGIERSA